MWRERTKRHPPLHQSAFGNENLPGKGVLTNFHSHTAIHKWHMLFAVKGFCLSICLSRLLCQIGLTYC